MNQKRFVLFFHFLGKPNKNGLGQQFIFWAKVQRSQPKVAMPCHHLPDTAVFERPLSCVASPFPSLAAKTEKPCTDGELVW